MGSLTLTNLIIILVSRGAQPPVTWGAALVFLGREGFVSASEMMLLKVLILSFKPLESMSYYKNGIPPACIGCLPLCNFSPLWVFFLASIFSNKMCVLVPWLWGCHLKSQPNTIQNVKMICNLGWSSSFKSAWGEGKTAEANWEGDNDKL